MSETMVTNEKVEQLGLPWEFRERDEQNGHHAALFDSAGTWLANIVDRYSEGVMREVIAVLNHVPALLDTLRAVEGEKAARIADADGPMEKVLVERQENQTIAEWRDVFRRLQSVTAVDTVPNMLTAVLERLTILDAEKQEAEQALELNREVNRGALEMAIAMYEHLAAEHARVREALSKLLNAINENDALANGDTEDALRVAKREAQEALTPREHGTGERE